MKYWGLLVLAFVMQNGRHVRHYCRYFRMINVMLFNYRIKQAEASVVLWGILGYQRENMPCFNTKTIAQHKIQIIFDGLILHNVVILLNQILVWLMPGMYMQHPSLFINKNILKKSHNSTLFAAYQWHIYMERHSCLMIMIIKL